MEHCSFCVTYTLYLLSFVSQSVQAALSNIDNTKHKLCKWYMITCLI